MSASHSQVVQITPLRPACSTFVHTLPAFRVNIYIKYLTVYYMFNAPIRINCTRPPRVRRRASSLSLSSTERTRRRTSAYINQRPGPARPFLCICARACPHRQREIFELFARTHNVISYAYTIIHIYYITHVYVIIARTNTQTGAHKHTHTAINYSGRPPQ